MSHQKSHRDPAPSSASDQTRSASSGRQRLAAELAGLPPAEQVQRLQPPRALHTFAAPPTPAVQMEEGPPRPDDVGPSKPPPDSGGYAEAAKAVAKAWLKTETGKQVVEKAKEFALSKKGLPFTIIAGTGALAAMIANEMELPVGSLKLDVTLFSAGDKDFKLELKPIWKGPLTNPEEYGGMVSLNITDIVKRDTGVEPGRVARDRELFVFEGRLMKPDGSDPDSNHAVILVDSSNRPAKRTMTYPGNGDYEIRWWADPWADSTVFKLVVIPGAGGSTPYKKVAIPIDLKDYYQAGRHPHGIGNYIQLEELGGGMRTMYFDYPP